MNGQWSKELREYTLRHFEEHVIVNIKNTDGRTAVSMDMEDYIKSGDDLLGKLPEEVRGKRFLLLDHGMKTIIAACDTVQELLDGGWAMD